MKTSISLLASSLILLLAVGCQQASQEQAPEPEPPISAQGFQEENLQELLINAEAGTVIQLAEGTFNFSRSISLDETRGITLRGMGPGKTILSFKNQTDGAEGLLVKADDFTVEKLAILDAKGDAIKVQGSDGVTIRDVRVGWTGGPSPDNGAYGLYPVSSNNVLVEGCEVYGASDAGIYVGQSTNIIVRRNKVYENVAGIEIENSFDAEVYENDCTNNTGGILVFDLPELPVKNGKRVNVHHNRVIDNNHENFAPENNMVGIVPAGSGVLVMSTTDVWIHDNEISGHNTFSAAAVSFLITGRPYSDESYSPYVNRVSFSGNNISTPEAEADVSRPMGQVVQQLFGNRAPDVVLGGIWNPDEERAICLNTPDALVADLDAGNGFAGAGMVELSKYQCTLEAPQPVRLTASKPAQAEDAE